MKIGCVIQGDIRRGSEYVLHELPALFDFTVLSTWENDEAKIPTGQFSVILNKKPAEGGLTNRNYQRLTTARGVRVAKDAGCDYVLKLRTDMLPTRLDVDELVRWADTDVPLGMKSRLVMPAFRALTVEPDWFSSISDIFAFAHIDTMEMLWGDSDFDYSSKINLPSIMQEELRCCQELIESLGDLYCAESELYAIFRARLQTKLANELDHYSICKKHLYLVDHRRLGIYWFDNEVGFRSIYQAWEHPWWSESIWRRGKPSIISYGYPVNGFVQRLKAAISPVMVFVEKKRQSINWWLRE